MGNSRNKMHQTWGQLFSPALYMIWNGFHIAAIPSDRGCTRCTLFCMNEFPTKQTSSVRTPSECISWLVMNECRATPCKLYCGSLRDRRQNVRKYASMCRKNVLRSYAEIVESTERGHAYNPTCIKRRGCMFRRKLALLFYHPLFSLLSVISA